MKRDLIVLGCVECVSKSMLIVSSLTVISFFLTLADQRKQRCGSLLLKTGIIHTKARIKILSNFLSSPHDGVIYVSLLFHEIS